MSKEQKTKKVEVTAVPQNEIVKIEKENKPVVAKAATLAVKSADDETAAFEVLTAIAGRLKMIETRRTAITKPINDSLKEVNKLFKCLSEPLKEADAIIRGKILDFRSLREAQALARQAKLEEKAQIAASKGDDEKAEELQTKATFTAPIVGDSVTSKRWNFEVTDEMKIPRNFLQVDEKAIRDAIRDGVREIAGVKIYQVQGLRVSSR